MATRYLCLAATERDLPAGLLERVSSLAGLQPALQSTGLAVLVGGDHDTVRLSNSSGIVIGNLFERCDNPHPLTELGASQSQAVSISQGQVLIDQFWGGYVAILPQAGDTLVVVRDPSGAMPCYYCRTSWGTVLSSDVETLAASGLVTGDIDWAFLYRHFQAYEFRSPRTALTGVTELLPGFRARITSGTLSTEACWSPWDYTSPTNPADDDALAKALHDTVQSCTKGWAHRYGDILLGVSGGLDSSIVAACVAQTPVRLTCLTTATHEAEGDERPYARLLTDALNLPLVEHFHALADVDVTRTTSAHLPRPLLLAFGQSEHRIRRELATTYGISGHFSGVGGDNVFCFLKSATPLLDRFRMEGLSRGVFETLEDICDLTGCSRPEAIWAALRRAMSHGATYQVAEETRFLNRNFAGGTQRPSHPWLRGAKGALPGKGAHIASLARIQGTIDGYARDEPPLVPVLLSQPVVELCLSIPTWRWLAGGRDRALARRAFTPRLPQALIDRRSKGGPNSFAFDVIDSNKKVLREFLLGGLLVEHDLIDPNALAKVLWSAAPLPAGDVIRIAMMAEAEAWARHWKSYLRAPVLDGMTDAHK